MKILLTGSEGYVGSHLLPFLREKEMDVTPFEGDIRDKENWWKYNPTVWDFLIHLAAVPGVRKSFEDPEFYYDNNVNGTRNALEFARLKTRKALYASSSNAYEWWLNPYATTKKICEDMAEPDPKVKGMRFHTVWPGREDMLYRKLEKRKVTYINAGHSRDWIHIDDLCEAIWTIMINFDSIDKKVMDIGTGKSVPVLSMAEKRFYYRGEIKNESPVGERIKTQADVQYLYDLGWKPKNNII